MNPEQRIKALEDEVKVLKNEVKTVLLDIREHYLGLENPFSLHRVTPGQESPADISREDIAQDVKTSPEETRTGKEELPVASLPNIAKAAGECTSGVPGKIDLITIVGLTQWVNRATSRLGKTKAEALIEVYHTTGRLTPGIREVLIKLARLSDTEKSGNGQLDSRDYLSILTELDNLVNGGGKFEAALLSILSDEEVQP